MKKNSFLSFFKEKEEKKDLYHINIPLLFLEWCEHMNTKKIHLNARFLYYPSIFLSIWFFLIIGGKYIETYLSFPAVSMKEDISIADLQGEHFIIQSGKNQIHAFYKDSKKEKTIFYFHGNGASMKYFQVQIEFFSSLGYNVMTFDYPGYGKSSGFPLEASVNESVDSVYSTLKNQKKLKEENIIVVGESIGTAPAIRFSQNKNIDSLILLSPFTSRYDLSREIYGFALQKAFFMPNSMNSLESIQSISSPTLIIHGNNDKIIPFSQGKDLFRKSPSNKKYFIELEKTGHNDIFIFHKKFLASQIKDFITYKTLERKYTIYSKQEGDLTKDLPTLQEKILEHQKQFLKDFRPFIGSGSIGTGAISTGKKTDNIPDYSLVKYVSPEIGFSDIGYIPNELVPINSQYVVDQKGNTFLRKEAKEALENMARDFYNEFGTKIGIASGYRSYTHQKSIKERGCSDALCAHPGHSEHQTGLAIDVFEASNEDTFLGKENLKNYFSWMKKHAHKYGFHNTYQKGLKVDGYMVEPWHWRYLGTELATYLHENKITFAEYYKQNSH